MTIDYDRPIRPLTDQQKMILIIFEDGKKYSIKKIASILDINRASAARTLKELSTKELVMKNEFDEYVTTDEGKTLTHKIIDKEDYYSDMTVFLHKRKSRFGLFGFLFVFLGWYGYANPSVYTQAFGDAVNNTGIAKNTALGGVVITTEGVASLTIISIVIIGGGGIPFGDAYYSNPSVEYSVYPGQMPAELHGVSLYVQDVYSTNDKSKITGYECDNESIIHDLDYSFECITENSLGNKESVVTTISVREPNNQLGEIATQCVEQYNVPTDGISRDYPYLSELPNLSTTTLSDYKNAHVKLMDDYFTAHDYEGAKKHATIVLKYFNVNDLQALSTLGNVMRDEDRTNNNGVNCAIAVHSTMFIANTAWGKLSLAEDHHVLGDYDESARWSSQVINEYITQTKDTIHEISYVNGLVINANALYRQTLVGQGGNFDEAKRHYSMAHDIIPSYDTWFGLGNIDLHEGNIANALEKYKEAKKFAGTDSIEIDDAISKIS